MYNKGDKVLLKNTWKIKFNQDAHLGAYTITAIRSNSTAGAYKKGHRSFQHLQQKKRNNCSSIMEQYDIHMYTQL